jgi:hypothetical protein
MISNESDGRIVPDTIRKGSGGSSKIRRVTRQNPRRFCVCREVLTAILGDGHIDFSEQMASGLGKEGVFYYLCLLSGARFCLEQGEKRMGGRSPQHAMTLDRKKIHDYDVIPEAKNHGRSK